MDPITDFSSLALSPELQAVLSELGFDQLTPIQAQSIPVLLSGKDLIGQSKTGSGKTAAFSIPILEKIKLDLREIQALILCPTRELCTQVASEIRRLGRKHPGLQVLTLSGGVPGRPQMLALRAGVHIAVGTPGRVLDHMSRGNLNLNEIATLVLDEADRMLDMGFEEDMRLIMDGLPGTRQTVFFSATYPSSIQVLSRKYQHAPTRITIEDTSDSGPAIQQLVFDVDEDEKIETLVRIIRQYQPESAIVFCNQKASISEVSEVLEQKGIGNACLHGDLEQQDRDRVMAMFRNGSQRVLIATDVAGRGIDIENLQMVINFDLPHQSDVYVHRIGRTGRAGKTGLAISIVDARERMRLYEFEQKLGVKITTGKLGLARAEKMSSLAINHGANMQTLSISGGRKDKLRPGDILGALTGEAGGLEGTNIGKIEILDHLSYVAITRTVAQKAMSRLRTCRIKGRKFAVKLID